MVELLRPRTGMLRNELYPLLFLLHAPPELPAPESRFSLQALSDASPGKGFLSDPSELGGVGTEFFTLDPSGGALLRIGAEGVPVPGLPPGGSHGLRIFVRRTQTRGRPGELQGGRAVAESSRPRLHPKPHSEATQLRLRSLWEASRKSMSEADAEESLGGLEVKHESGFDIPLADPVSLEAELFSCSGLGPVARGVPQGMFFLFLTGKVLLGWMI